MEQGNNPGSTKEPEVSQYGDIFRICLAYRRATGASHPIKDRVRNRIIDPADLPQGTWAVQFFDEQTTIVDHMPMKSGARNCSLTLIASRIYTGKAFTKNFQEVAQALKHDGARHVIQVPAHAYEFNADDISGQFRIVPKGARVIDTQGELIWPKFRNS